MRTATSAKKNIPSQFKFTAAKQQAFQLVDKRPEAAMQLKMMHALNQYSDQQYAGNPTQLKSSVLINDDNNLEKEADVMGQKAMQFKSREPLSKPSNTAPVSSGKVVQRYTILDPANYQTSGVDQQNMFPSNQLENTDDITHNEGVKSVTSKLNWVKRYSNNPPLKMSQNGILALESTVGQPQVFYGKSENVQNFSKRLTNIKSRITLQEAPGATVTTPKDPLNPNGETQDLIRVEPVRNSHILPTQELMDNHVCLEVSNNIVGGKELVIGNTVDNEKVVGPINNSTAARFGGIMNEMDRNSTTEDFVDGWNNYPAQINLKDTNLPISQDVRKYFENGLLSREHLVPGDQVLRALSVDGIPKRLLKQVYELYVGKTPNQRPDEVSIIDHIGSYLKVKNTVNYRKSRDKHNLKSKLGINEMASPEVGEAFSTYSHPSPSTMDENGVVGHGVDFTNMNNSQLETMIDRFLEIKTSVKKLGMLAKSQYQKAKGMVQFGEHHGAVVAKDESDTITFENYNRGAESDLLQEELWEAWFRKQDEFNLSIDEQVREMLKEVRTHEQNPRSSNFDKQFMVLRTKKEALKTFQLDFVTVSDTVRAKLEMNVLREANNLWHFNMYGPAGKTYTDEKGIVRGQSFHDVWSKSIPNSVTVRTTGLMDQQMKDNLRKKVYHILYQKVINDQFNNPLSSYDTAKNDLLQNIELPKKRFEYSDMLIALEEREQDYAPLNPQEKFEAEALFSGKTYAIFMVLLSLKHDQVVGAKTQFFDTLYRRITALDEDSDEEWD